LGINLSNPGAFTWIQYVEQNLCPQIILLWPCIFGVFGSYIFCRECIENTYKNLLVIPVGRIPLAMAKLLVMLVSIMAMALLTYVLNLSGMLIGVRVGTGEFLDGLGVYALAGFLLSICLSIVYALASFLYSWVAPMADLLHIDVAWRIMDLQQFEMTYAFSMSVSLISLTVIAIGSIIGILYASKTQEA
ncbi:ABC transporter permease, partial [Eubacterium aggregans]